ncbi:histidine kinase [Paenibacillus qinlingensis]|uniref:Two-component system sensor histidine kinase YesM n=1 Tax=Paenibacillus qinlingensis TaxID=1837343 RepID=A0ABU1P523_9BACL|nr:histidine kinase [Paenibacillus qinlingensis]MDR6554853.1 two-component system sensor histidine kinase YesM [Paenibacillus qinlingensis]
MFKKIKTSLKWKLISLLITILVSVVAMIGFFSYFDTSRTIRQDAIHSSEQILRQANLNLDRQYMEYERGFLVLGTSDEFIKWLQIDPKDQFELISGYHSLENNFLHYLLLRHPEILSVSMRSDKGGEFHYALSVGLSKDYSLLDEGWLSEVRSWEKVQHRVGPSTNYLEVNKNPKQQFVLTMAGQFGRPLSKGILKMDITLEPAQSILSQMQLGKQGSSLIAKPDGTILVHQSADKIGSVLESDIIAHLTSDSGSFIRKETNQLIVFDTIPYTGWKTVVILSLDDITNSINRVRNVTIVVASLGMIMGIIFVTLVATSVTRRLSSLRSNMKQAQFGNFKSRLHIKGEDEVSDLSHSFNRMLEELDSSIQQLTDTKLMQQRAAFSAMQSQIHSHFLYNALESINSMAHLAGHDRIERASISLSRMLRYTSNFRDTYVRVEDEISHVIHYMNISQIRYGEGVSFHINLPDDCRDALCLKVVLQPIAENAIKHGIETTGEPTRLEVTVHREGDLVCVVFEDNGNAYDPERLEAFRSRLREPMRNQEEYTTLTNVGLLNVHYRILAFYQMNGIGVDIDSDSRLGGVKVTVRVPFKKNIEKER